MIESGLVLLVGNGLTNQSLIIPPGFPDQLPENFISGTGSTVTQAWVYRSISSTPTYFLDGQSSFTSWVVQIDSHGKTAALAKALSEAIDLVLRGIYSGTLPDVDSTIVSGIFRMGSSPSLFNDTSRTYVRCTDYKIQYYHSQYYQSQDFQS